jgi:hypothetical protein
MESANKPKVGLDRTKTGRKKGTPNKTTSELKEMVFAALHAGGGQKYLERQMDENPTAFMTLLGKFVPKDVNVGGQADNPLSIKQIEIVVVDPKA